MSLVHGDTSKISSYDLFQLVSRPKQVDKIEFRSPTRHDRSNSWDKILKGSSKYQNSTQFTENGESRPWAVPIRVVYNMVYKIIPPLRLFQITAIFKS